MSACGLIRAAERSTIGVNDADEVIEHILEHYAPANPKIDRTDGISLEFADWRFNLRASNTEPLLRLNIETRADLQAVQAHVKQLEEQIYFLNNQKG